MQKPLSSKSSHSTTRDAIRATLRVLLQGICSRVYWRLVLATAIIDIALLTLQGIAFLMIGQGVTLALIRFALIWRPAGRLVALVAHNPDESLRIPEIDGPWWRAALIA